MATQHAGENPLAGANEPVIINHTFDVANFEYTITAPKNTRKFIARSKFISTLFKLAFAPGESGTNNVLVFTSGYSEDNIGVSYLKLYVQAQTAGWQAEFIFWS